MRGRLLDMPAIGRAVGFALVAAAMVAAAVHFHQNEPRLGDLHIHPAEASDPLSEELKRCQSVAAKAKDDAACEAAWAESRGRFFTYQPALGATTPPAAPAKSSDR